MARQTLALNKVEHQLYNQPGDLGRMLEIFEWIFCFHSERLSASYYTIKFILEYRSLGQTLSLHSY